MSAITQEQALQIWRDCKLAHRAVLTDSDLHAYAEAVQALQPTHIQVGDFSISPGIEKGRVWIERSSGEGGDFRIETFEAVVRKFYNDNF